MLIPDDVGGFVALGVSDAGFKETGRPLCKAIPPLERSPHA